MSETILSINLKTIRQSLHLSRKEVSEKIGISASTLADYENGYAQPSLNSLVSLAQLYNTTTDHLLGLDIPSARTLDVTGLTDEQIDALQHLVHTISSQ